MSPTTKLQIQVLLLGLMALWLWWPALSPVPVEGFSAVIGIIGLSLAEGTLAQVDTAYPFNTEFFGLTRLGMDGLVALGTRLGLSPSAAMASLHLASFAALIAGSVAFVRQWSDASIRPILLALLMVPGIGESAFFLHENMLAAALLTGALVMISARQDWASALVTGVLLAGAMLTRTDAVLLTPAIPVILWIKVKVSGRFWNALIVSAIASAFSYLLVLRLFNVTPLDVLTVARRSVQLWQNSETTLRSIREGTLFLGLPGAALVLFGCMAVAREGNRGRRVLLIGLPLLFLSLYGDKLWQARQYLPLTPFVVTLAALGAQGLWRILEQNWMRAIPISVMVYLWLTPGSYVLSDGPRAYEGRFFSPLAWHQWQEQVRHDRRNVDRGLESLSAGGFILTDDWNVDRYTHLALLEAGWRPNADPSCSSNVDDFSRDGVTIQHVRLHLPFLPNAVNALPALFEQFNVQCRPLRPDAPIVRIAVEPPAVESASWFVRMPAFRTVSQNLLVTEDVSRLAMAYTDAVGEAALTFREVAHRQTQLSTVTGFINPKL